jgi:hypothetical protein
LRLRSKESSHHVTQRDVNGRDYVGEMRSAGGAEWIGGQHLMVGDSVQGMAARGSDGLCKGLITDTVVEFRMRGERWNSAHFVKYLLRKKYLNFIYVLFRRSPFLANVEPHQPGYYKIESILS